MLQSYTYYPLVRHKYMLPPYCNFRCVGNQIKIQQRIFEKCLITALPQIHCNVVTYEVMFRALSTTDRSVQEVLIIILDPFLLAAWHGSSWIQVLLFCLCPALLPASPTETQEYFTKYGKGMLIILRLTLVVRYY